MDTIESLNKEIMLITMFIKENRPELYVLLGEMPITIPKEKTPEVALRALRDYKDSLQNFIKHHSIEYKPTI